MIMFDDFLENTLNENYWIPTYLPQWSSRKKAFPSYKIENSILTLYISDNQEPWCPEWNGEIRVSNLQTGVFSGQVGSSEGQHRFTEGLVVREEQKKCFLVTPKYGTVEMKARCKISDENVAALWLIGVEEEPHQSAEICLFELKGYNVNKDSAIIGFGVHPFGDKKICDEFYEERFEIDVTEWNTYRFTWTQNDISFFINNNHIKTIKQSPDYPMQLMLNLYDLQNINNEKNVFEIDYVMVDD